MTPSGTIQLNHSENTLSTYLSETNHSNNSRNTHSLSGDNFVGSSVESRSMLSTQPPASRLPTPEQPVASREPAINVEQKVSNIIQDPSKGNNEKMQELINLQRRLCTNLSKNPELVHELHDMLLKKWMDQYFLPFTPRQPPAKR